MRRNKCKAADDSAAHRTGWRYPETSDRSSRSRRSKSIHALETRDRMRRTVSVERRELRIAVAVVEDVSLPPWPENVVKFVDIESTSGWMSARVSLSTSRVRSVGAAPKRPGPSANYLPGSNSLIARTYVVTLLSLMFECEETRTTEPSAPLADFIFFIRTRFLEMIDAGAPAFIPLSC